MGICGVKCASELDFTREAQDEFSRESYRRAHAAMERGATAAEIVPVTVKGRKGDVVVEQDEEPHRAKLDRMSSLRPAFAKDGTITADNASKIDDGASATVLASGAAVDAHGLKPLARIVGYGGHAQDPTWFTRRLSTPSRRPWPRPGSRWTTSTFGR